MIFRYPVNYIAITTLYSSSHRGLDLGWSNKHGGKEQPIYAAADGEVYVTHDKDRTGKSWGNYIKIKHDKNTYTLYGHLKEGSLLVHKGDKVKKGQHIATMGNSGLGGKYHTHFEIYEGGANTKYRVNPLPLTYAYPDQVVCELDVDIVKTYTPVVEPTERDATVDQLKVLKDKLRIRKEPSLNGDILDFAKKEGIYNDLDSTIANGYVWHKIGDSNWLADVTGYIELLPKLQVGDKVTFKELPNYFIIDNIQDNKANVVVTTSVNNLNKID